MTQAQLRLIGDLISAYLEQAGLRAIDELTECGYTQEEAQEALDALTLITGMEYYI